MTDEEKHLWFDFLKNLPVTINRQKVIGRYILDFYCASANIAIELDGSQHYSEEGKGCDAKRDAFLQSKGISVLRYSIADVNKRFDTVKKDILNHIRQKTDVDL